VWAPALVAFVGGGAGFRFSAGVGVGWFPLGPGEVFLPGYRVSRNYVNNVNITNTAVNITRVTNVYNTVVINKTAVNEAYVNQRVSGGVTVVSRDAFVNARPVAQNIMRVEPRELAVAPVTHVVGVEPVRQSVIGAGRVVTVRPPAAVMSRPVVAQRTPPPPPRPIEQRQAQAGGHLNQQPLVRQEAAGRAYQAGQGQANQAAQPQGRPAQSSQPSQGFHSFGQQPTNHVKQTQAAPRVYEQQGTLPAENQNDAPNRAAQPASRPAASAQTHPLVRPAPPVQERSPQQEQQQAQKFSTWQQQRPVPAAQPKESSRPPAPAPAPKEEKPAKK
jgi:hypothetical protein